MNENKPISQSVGFSIRSEARVNNTIECFRKSLCFVSDSGQHALNADRSIAAAEFQNGILKKTRLIFDHLYSARCQVMFSKNIENLVGVLFYIIK